MVRAIHTFVHNLWAAIGARDASSLVCAVPLALGRRTVTIQPCARDAVRPVEWEL